MISAGATLFARGCRLTAIGVYLVLLGSPAAARAQLADGPPPATAPGEYIIQVGDQLEIKFFYNPVLNEQVIVRPDGRFSLQLVHEVVAAGLTPAALTKELSDRYAVELKQPELSVLVRGFGAQRIFVDGEVAKPGMFSILGLTTARQAIAQAGGLKDTAHETEVVVIRRSAGGTPTAFRVDLKQARDGRAPAQDVSLEPFDIVFVPRSRVANVNLWMDQYLRKNIPIPFGLTYGLIP